MPVPAQRRTSPGSVRRDFNLLFLVMLVIASGNTALQSVLPAIGRSFELPDTVVAFSFSLSALIWMLVAPAWARQSDKRGRKAMVLLGVGGFTVSLTSSAIALSAGIAGWLTPAMTFLAFVAGRLVYGALGSAAPPAAQALVASRTSRDARTRALTMLASAFGLGTIAGPALAPFFVLPGVGLAGPAWLFALLGLVVTIIIHRWLTNDAPDANAAGVHGAAASEPMLNAQPGGASIIAATAERNDAKVALRDPRVWPWMLFGLVAGHAQAAIGQSLGFLIIDRLGLPPAAAQPMIGVVLMTGASAALLAQWGIIPRLRLDPRQLVLWGAGIGAIGAAAICIAEDLHALAVAYAIVSVGFGFIRPGFTAGASLAVEAREQGAVAGTVTSVNGAVFILGPSAGVALYELWAPLPYLLSAVALAALVLYALKVIRPSTPAA